MRKYFDLWLSYSPATHLLPFLSPGQNLAEVRTASMRQLARLVITELLIFTICNTENIENYVLTILGGVEVEVVYLLWSTFFVA